MPPLLTDRRGGTRADSDPTVECGKCGADVKIRPDYRLRCPECGYRFE